MLPVSVLVPTRNSMALLPKHVESMQAWLDLAEEVVAVDSHSTDGTLEFLQRELKHLAARVLTHPPGLYQSWNFGIAQCRARYIYISTVGETITREGLSELREVAEKFAADAVISPPRMVRMDGTPKIKEWPVHRLMIELSLHEPVLMEGAAGALFAVVNLSRGILGSSASNLYRTAVLQRFPFRTDFGTAGDLAWGLEHSGEVRLAVVPRSFSTFMFHPKAYAKSDYAVTDFSRKCFAVASEMTGRRPWGSASSGPGAASMERLLGEALQAWDDYLKAKGQMLESRSRPLWWLSPAAWRAHRQRSVALRSLEKVQSDSLRLLAREFTCLSDSPGPQSP